MKIASALLLAFTLFMTIHQDAKAVDILVEGSFSASEFTETGSFAVTPDPLNLSFSVVVTIDETIFASNGFFEIDTVLDSITPNPLNIGTETFTAEQISVIVSRSAVEGPPELNGLVVALGIGEIGSLSSRTNDFRAIFQATINASQATAPQTLPLGGVVRLVNEPIGGAVEASTIQSGSVTLSLVSDPPSPTLSDFLYDASTNTFSVSLKGPPNTGYILVEADDLDFTNPDQKPIPLVGAIATVGSLDGNNIVTDGDGNATVVTVALGLLNKNATFIRAETP